MPPGWMVGGGNRGGAGGEVGARVFGGSLTVNVLSLRFSTKSFIVRVKTRGSTHARMSACPHSGADCLSNGHFYQFWQVPFSMLSPLHDRQPHRTIRALH